MNPKVSNQTDIVNMMWDDVDNWSTGVVTTTGSSSNWKVYQGGGPTVDVAEQRHQELLEKFDYIQLPADLDLRNETVQSAVADWYEALERLKLKHQQLKMLIDLTKTHE
jgi:hypothetical protein